MITKQAWAYMWEYIRSEENHMLFRPDDLGFLENSDKGFAMGTNKVLIGNRVSIDKFDEVPAGWIIC